MEARVENEVLPLLEQIKKILKDMDGDLDGFHLTYFGDEEKPGDNDFSDWNAIAQAWVEDLGHIQRWQNYMLDMNSKINTARYWAENHMPVKEINHDQKEGK